MDANHCRSCYRAIAPEDVLCKTCEVAERRGPRVAVALGTLGLPILIAGMLLHSTRICVAGAVVAGVAVLLHIVLTLR